MAIRLAEIFEWRAGHQEIFQDAILNHVGSLGGLAFVVVLIPTGESGAIQFSLRRIIRDAQKFRQDQLVYFLRKSLSFIFATLAMALEAMAKNFVKENRSSASGKKRRAVERFGDRGFAERGQIFSHFRNMAGD